MYQWPPDAYFGNSTDIRFLEESGGSFDATRNQMIIWGGGHKDYAGNEIYVFNIDTLRWARINEPSPRLDTNGSIESTGYYPDATGNADPQQPRSRHGYWYQVYVPDLDRYCSLGASFTFPNSLSLPNVDCFDFDKKRWERKQDAMTFAGLATAIYDPATHKVWVHGRHWDNALGFLSEWNPVTDTWTKRSAAPSGVKQGSAPALDTLRHQLASLGDEELRIFDLKQSGLLTPKLVALRGDTEILSMTRGGFAYDPVNDKYVAWSGDTTKGVQPADIYVIDPATWTSRRTKLGGARAPRSPKQFSTGGTNGVYGRLAYVPSKGVFILINNQLDEDVFFFRLSSSTNLAASTTPAAPPSSPLTSPLPAAITSSGSDFLTLCSQSGVLRCVGFDAASDLAGTYGDNSGTLPGDATPEIDFSVRASGNGSLRFTIPSKSSANSSGSYFTNFSSNLQTQFGENSEFYVQWRQRFSPEFISTVYGGGGGWKQAIIGTGDKPGCSSSNSATGLCYSSCTPLETVIQNTYTRGFAQMYNSCKGSASHRPYDAFDERFGNSDFKLQNGRPAPYCLYSSGQTSPPAYFPPAGNCIGYFPDEWMTFQIHIKTGPRVNDEFTNSFVQLWIGREGQPMDLAENWGPYGLTADDPETNQKFGKIWLLPYNTGKDPSVSYPVAYTWYDDLIISTRPIGTPKGSTP